MSSCKFAVAAPVVLLACGWFTTSSSFGQDATPPQPPPKPATTQRDQAPASQTPDNPPPGNGKIIFSRSLDDTTLDKPSDATAKQQPGSNPSAAVATPPATDAERKSLTFLAYNLDVRLTPKQESLAVRAQLTVRNDGDKPMKRIALQLSSTLRWEEIKSGANNLVFTQQPIDSDADHTGTIDEAVATLPSELAPKQELKLDVLYSGKISLSAERLERIGAPQPVAEKSDWDRISPEFTGLRGFGNVLWYPVSAPPAMLGDGAKLFAEIGQQKLRQQPARVMISVTSEYTADTLAPNLAVLDGHVVPVTTTATPENSYPGIITASLPETPLGFAVPSLFLLWGQSVAGDGVQIFTSSEDAINAQALLTAANVVKPLVQQWLGDKPKSPLTIVGLPDPDDASAEEGGVYFTGIKGTPDPKALEDAMVHSLAHSYFQSHLEWLNEGVPQFLGTLWIEQVKGRQAALEALESARGALAMAEPGTPGQAAGQDLSQAADTVYYRAKSAYVLWMLRDLAGDAPLAATLKAYSTADDASPDYFEKLLRKNSGKDLHWFFDAWVYHDRGLPDLAIGDIFPTKSAEESQWLVAFDITNDGYAEVEVPVTLRSQKTSLTERIRIPARGKISHRMLIQGLPTELQVNDGTVPEVAQSIHIRKLTVAAE
jgi:hypothetical protein